MPNIAAAREEITKAAGLLVNRFGHESDVFARLNAALAYLRDEPAPKAPQVHPEQIVRVEPEPETVTTGAASEESMPLSDPPLKDAAPDTPFRTRRNRR